MRTDKIRKYVLPNIPYLFIGWACLKMGTAYRLAAGANFGEKLLGLMQTIGVAFADFSPGLDPFDWLIGFVGAVAFRLLIYFKSKNAKKYRRDEEYGSARWGGPKDIQPFVDPKFENNVILTGTELLTMNTRPKIPANARNLNACIIGSSGSGKTRFWLTPQLLQAHSSYVVVDPKGGVLGQVGYFLQKKRGYKIKVFNSIDFSKSMHYNPLAYIKNEADILKFVNALISNTDVAPLTGLLYCADCGGKMYVHRFNNGKRISQYTCSKYSKIPVGTLCKTQHRINESVVLELVKDLLKAIAEYAKHERAEFVRVVQEAQSSQQTAEVKKQRTRLATAKQRISELEVLLCKIYEDNILGKLSDSRYATLDAQYEKEQKELTAEISTLEKAISDYEKHEKDADRFIALIDKYENFDELTITMLNEFVEKILVHERDRKGSIQTTQEVEIYFNFVGRFVPPKFAEVELTPEELEEIRKREERKDRLHQNYLKRKASGWQRQYEDRTKAKKKAEMDAKKNALRAEDIAKGVFIPVSNMPKLEPKIAPQKGA